MKSISLLIVLFMFAYVSKSQVDAGEDISISAGLPVMVQGNYTGYTGIGVTAEDDAFVGPFEIGFEFTYFGETFNRFAVGPNGLLSFDVPGIIGESPNDPVAIPTGVYPKTILGPYQDMFSRPAPPHSNYIFYRTVGEAPNRKLILGWCEAPMYICDENKISCQIVLEETTNKIMNHIIAKPECFPHYGNNATQGLNMSSNLGVPVTGRNNTSWTATYESWECIPDGDNNYSITQIEFEPEVIIPTGKLSFAWYKDSYPGGELVSNEANAVVYPTASASYFCEISLCSGVTYVDELKVNVIPIPNAFNPNSNVLENRIFKVFANPVEGVSNFTMYIYDRWGKLMFETSKINEGWDGTSNGSNCATGVYVWVIYYKEGNEELTNKGMVTLVR